MPRRLKALPVSILAAIGVMIILLISPTSARADVNTQTEIQIANSSPYALISSKNGAFVYYVDNSLNLAVRVSTTTYAVSSLAVGGDPQGVSESPDGTKVYVSNTADSTISVVDTASWALLTTWTLASNTAPMQSVASPDGSSLFVTSDSGSILRINTATGGVIVLNSAVIGQSAGILLSPDGAKLYVIDELSNRVSVMDASTGAVLSNIAVGTGPQYGQISADGTFLYVGNQNGSSISVINTATLSVISTYSLGSLPRFLSLSPDGTTLAIGSFSGNNVTIMNASTGVVQQTLAPTDPNNSVYVEGVAFTPNGASLWAGAQGVGNIYRWNVSPPLYTPAPTPTPTPTSTATEEPTLSVTGLDTTPYFLFSGALVGGGVIALAAALILRRRASEKSE